MAYLIIFTVNLCCAISHFIYHRNVAELYANMMLGFSVGFNVSTFFNGSFEGETLKEYKERKWFAVIYSLMALLMILASRYVPRTETEIGCAIVANVMMIRKFWSDAIS